MSFPPGTEMFQFPGFASATYVFSCGSSCEGVAPFGYPWIKGCSPLPMAFRSVPRPSSPPGAKASTECPFVVQFSSSHIKVLNTLQCATHHKQEPSISSAHALHSQCPPLGTANTKNFTRHDLHPMAFDRSQQTRSHNAQLNTRAFHVFTSRPKPLGRSDTQTQKPGPARLSTNQYTRPIAPKPIHHDKEHFCSSTTWLGTNPSPHQPDLLRNRPTRLEFRSPP